MGKDEDETDRYLDRLGKTSARYCGKRYVDSKGTARVCTRKAGHRGKCK